MPKSRGESADHLLLLPGPADSRVSLKNSFFERDWSGAWANFLMQEAGFFALARDDQFDASQLVGHRFVYLPSSLAASSLSKHSSSFKKYVEAGGTLVLEGQASNLFDFSGVRFSSKTKILKALTQIEKNKWPGPLVDSLMRLAFETQGWDLESSRDGLETILEMAGTPVFFRRRLGKGEVFLLGFDFGMLLVGLQQGIPVKGTRHLQKLFGTQFRLVQPADGSQGRVIEPEDLVLKAALLNNSVPWADLFERFLFKTITGRLPVPRWWYFPKGVTGALISSHDEEAVGPDPRLEAMLKEEKSRGVRSTLFVISNGPFEKRWGGNGILSRWASEGTEIGLHWNRFQKPRLKFRRFQGGWREEPLHRQIKVLEEAVKQPVRINRTHYLALGTRYGDHFKSLSSHGIPFDSTYGPNQGGRGYLFGTGYPYYGITWEGFSSGVLELPFHIQETWGGANLDFLKLLISESDKNFHQAVVMNFHPHYRVLEQEGGELWLGGLDFAREQKQWMPSMGEFFEFFKARCESPVRMQGEGRQHVSVDAKRDDLALSFPARAADGRKLGEVRVDGCKVEMTEIQNAWLPEMIVPVPQGEHRVEVFYE